MFIETNRNPMKKRVGDCVIRALSAVMNEPWDRVYIDVMLEGFSLKDMPSANYVWGAYLKRNGYIRETIPNTCPKCYSVKDFCKDHPEGRYILGTGQHAIAVIDGDYLDTWDSGDEVPVFYWKKGDPYGDI
jgi:hypothetical protein